MDLGTDVEEFVAELGAAGVTLSEEGGRLRYRAPKGVLTPDWLDGLRVHRGAVIDLLRRREYGPPLVIDPAAAYEPFPLTDVQEAYLLGRSNAFAYGGVACHGYLELSVPPWDAKRIEDAWNHLIRRHPMLRAVVFADGYQQILPEVPRYRVQYEDLRGVGQRTIDAATAAARAAMSHQIRRTEQWPLFELRATRTDDGLVLHLGIDLLICDYSSIRILLGELRDLCADPVWRPRDPTPGPDELSFRDYVLGVRGTREGTRYQRDRDYWWSRIDDLPPAPDLPLRVHAARAEPHFSRHGLRLPADRWRDLDERARAAGVTASGVLQQAFAETVGRWSSRPSFTLSLTLRNRLPLHPDVDTIVGDFSSTTLLAVDLTEGSSFVERLRAVQARLWEDMDHQLCSGVEVLRELGRRRGRAEALLPVTFTSTLAGAAGGETRETGAASLTTLMPDGELVHGITQTPQVWIDCQVMEDRNGLLVHWDVRDGVFPDGLVKDMFATFTQLLADLARGDAWTSADPVPLPAGQRERLVAYNDTAGPRHARSLHADILAQARRTPGRAAVVASNRTLTYAELEDRTDAVAGALVAAGLRPGGRVALVMEKGWEQVVGVLATLLAGGAYVPLDVTQPPMRRDLILRDAQVRHVLTQSALLGRLDLPDGIVCIPVDIAEPGPPAEYAPHEPSPDELAYVIYTSGSTGTPKGVMISHGAARNTIDDINARFAVTARDRVLGLAQLGFDLSVYDIFGPLSVGGALVLPAPERRDDPAHWARLAADEAVSVWNSVPAQMQMLETYLHDEPGMDFPRLRLAMLSGDWIPVVLPDAIRRRLPDLEVISLGGATEASIWSIYHRVATVDPAWASIPYGKPLTNQSFRVLDALMRDCPEHVTGELYIGGVGLALGYLGDPARTTERFVSHPHSGERLYRTGDLGRMLPTGEIEFLGRIDRQVKINGHRIELAEVEAALVSLPGVASAATTVRGKGSGRALVAFAELSGALVTPRPTAPQEKAVAAGLQVAAGLSDASVVEMAELLETSALQAMIQLIRSHDLCAPETAGHTAEEIIDAVRVAPQNTYLVRRWLTALEQEGVLGRDTATGRYRARTHVGEEERAAVLRRIHELEPETRWGAELLRYLLTSQDNLGPLVRNEIDLKTLLFPEGRLDTAEAAYRDNLISRHNNAAVIAAMREIAAGRSGTAPLRLLEIGAGVGGTSSDLVPALDGLGVEYLFTDLSHFFLDAAQERFETFPWVRYALFDLNRDIRDQGLAPNSYDVILLANVLHNAVHVGRVLARLRELLAPGGWLVFIEATRDAYHVMTSMEFNAGLTGFEDERGQTGSTFFGRTRWLEMIGDAGGEVAFCLPEPSSALSQIGQHVFAARFKADRAPVRTEEVLAHLGDRLPGYMIPTEIQLVDRIPLTGNGKIDRARLDSWSVAASRHRRDSIGAAPRDGLEQELARLWIEVLPVDNVGRESNFFDLGGDSLLMARLVSRMREELPEAAGLSWDELLRLIMNRPVIAQLAERLSAPPSGTGAGWAASPLVHVSDTPERPADRVRRVLVHDGTGTLIPYRAVISELSGQLPMSGLVVDDIEAFLADDPSTQVAALAERHTRALANERFDRVHLVGYCMGGLLVPELAERLSGIGVEVAGITIISSYRVPYLVEDELLAEYVFARLLRVDPFALGYPGDESGTRELIRAVTGRHANAVPRGALVEQPTDELTPAGVAALRAFQELSRRSAGDRLRAIGAAMPVENAELRSERRLMRQFQIVQHSMVSVALHTPTTYRRPATFVRQTGEAEVFPGMHRDMTDYWRQVCVGGLRIVDVPGDHFTCMRPPNAKAVAQALLPEVG